MLVPLKRPHRNIRFEDKQIAAIARYQKDASGRLSEIINQIDKNINTLFQYDELAVGVFEALKDLADIDPNNTAWKTNSRNLLEATKGIVEAYDELMKCKKVLDNSRKKILQIRTR